MTPISFSTEEKRQVDEYLKQIEANIAKEDQTPLERWALAEKHQEPNRAPTRLGSMTANSQSIGASIKDILLKPQKAVLANLATVALYAPDNVHPYAEPHVIGTEETGTKIRYPDDSGPVLYDYPIKEQKDLRTLEIPDPHKDGKLPMILEIIQTTYDLIGDKVTLTQNTDGPFGFAGDLMGSQKLLANLIREPEFVGELLDFTTELSIVIGKAVQETGAFPHPFDAMVSPHHIGKENYMKIVWPRHKTLMKALTPPGAYLGIDGHVLSIIDEYVDTGARQITIESFKDHDSLTEIVRRARGKTVLHVGAIRPNDFLYWEPERMHKYMGDIIAICAPNGGFVTGLGVVPEQATRETIRSIMDLAKELCTPPYGK